jgi:DNA segregation ATPase FtsK/SpoIIIE-like protein
MEDGDIDDNFKQAVEVVTQYDRASASLLQRRLSIGYARAARLIDQLEAAGVVGPAEGAEPREVLIRSVDEIIPQNGKNSQEKEVWFPEPPKNYKLPSGVKLSSAYDIPWGTQFSEVYKRTDFEDLKVEFPIPLGFDGEGNLKAESLLDVNNLIIAGNPLSQKENLVDTILLTNLLRYAPSQLKLILIDPTHYLDLYEGIPHLLSPVISDQTKEISALKWTLYEVERRQKQFAEKAVRNIRAFNEQMGFQALPYILTIIYVGGYSVETEDALVQLTTQGARTGIHNIIVTDHTSGALLPNILKSNIPARAIFRLTSAGESKAIDISGAEMLEPGELIYKPNYGGSEKLKALFTPETNVKEVTGAVKQAA